MSEYGVQRIAGADASDLRLQDDATRGHAVRPALEPRRQLVGGAAYTPAAVMAAYEVIRQVIDDAEHYRGLFLAVLADHRLHDDSVPKRGLAAYDALRLRLSNDVRPAAGENPLAPLVVLAA